MAYVQLAKALYDYEAQAEDELTLKEDDVLYILEADDPEWYKAKLKSEGGADEQEGPVGLVPANYVEEAEPMRLSRALYDYAAQNDDELDIAEDELLRVYETDGLWLLVKKQGDDALGEGGVGRLGYVPANYVDEVAAVDTGDAPEVEEEPSYSSAPAPGAAAIPMAPRNTSTATPAIDKTDGIKMWAVSLLDAKKKKKKGTLGIGNAALFFASESDKTPVQKIPVLSITAHAIENKGKQLHVDLDASAGIEGNAMNFVTDKKEADEIAAKLDESKEKAERMLAIAQEAPEEAEEAPAAEEEEAAAPPRSTPAPPAAPAAPPAPPAPPAAPAFQPPPARSTAILPPPVRKTATSPAPPTATEDSAAATNGHPAAPNGDGEPAIALYDFEAQGDDELTVAENESLTLVERENDDWWKVRNASGQEGVVPASYIEVAEAGATTDGAAGGAAASEDVEAERRRQEEAEALAAEREREQLLAAEQRRKEARDRLAREAEERRRREALKAQPAPAPPKVAPATTSAENARAARDVKIPEGRSAPARPKEAGSKSKPAPGRTRVWHDRSGQFRVEAEFLGFNQGKLRLHKINGVVIEVAIEKMSRPDIQYLEEVTGKQLIPSSRRSGGPSSSTAVGAPLSTPVGGDPRQSERERERRKEKEREARRRAEAGRGPKRNIDWFEFFLAAGVDVHDCTRYAAAFERDNIDDTVLEHMDASILRSLGLREGDNIRVMKHIERKYGARRAAAGGKSGGGAADIDKQMKADEELARKLQEQERAARRDAEGSSSQSLFSGPDGSLKNNTRRGRPTPKSTTDTSVDAASIAKAGESLSRVSSPPSRTSTTSPQVERKSAKAAAPASSGFDDDAWTPRPSSAKPSTPAPAPAPAASAPTPPPAPPAPAKAPTPPPAPAAPAAPVEPAKPAADPNSALFDKLAAMKAPSAGVDRPGASPAGQSSFMYNGPRGPMAPVPQNQGLLQPLVPTHGTGQYVPTRGGMGMQATGMGMQQTGMGMQQTGWGGMQQQPTGYGGYGQQQPTGYGGGMQSQPTGWMGQQQTAMQGTNVSGFGAGSGMGSPQPPAQQQQQPQQTGQSTTSNGSSNATANGGDKYGAGSIFASMKSGTFAQGDNAKAQQPQQAQRYDALRPQPTGWSPAGVQQPQATGMGMGGYGGGMGQQMTGMGGYGMGMGMQPQYTAQPGMGGFGQQQTGQPYGQQQGYGGGYGGYQGY
ncbi:hypothetical protein BDZ90DRAFT_232859 [Jaminaea rosea]|uniref:Actin cytoskeleton-regulatory complex protein SLA1 n=1 Tax=Jaminaea rosea TaxID=1569628 RepID=A0A316US92_9BASI|nr:hypothetical protein BDZ90DRAFT_232859 [Jaminaea rosea]PWN26743.1 hypothetical protein BDZ90DRAFT_232859 [Jaminaea rosea]